MRSFNIDSITETTDKWKEQINNEITSRSKSYLLGVNEIEYKNFLIKKYALELLEINFDNEQLGEPVKKKETREDRFFHEQFTVDIYYIPVIYRYTGSAEIFTIRPNPWNMADYEIFVSEQKGTVTFTVGIDKQDAEEFKRLKEHAKQNAFKNLPNANKNISDWNKQLPDYIDQVFQRQKTLLSKENDFFAALNLSVNKNADGLFSVPIIQKRVPTAPVVDNRKTFSSVPTFVHETYVQVLHLLNEVGRGMERKPSLYKGKDENGIRDFFLSQLEFRYDSVTATGETFNSAGKTDIILKYAPDGSNLFVAECKFWTGASGFLDTITQLFDRYLTWRDSKVAVMMFVRTSDFTAVLNNIRAEIRNHPYYVRNNGQNSESSFSYIFRLKQDESKEVHLEVMAFHFHKF